MQQVNSTKQQHFLSQAEQRLNALNPAASAANQRIFSFSLVDREGYLVHLETPSGRRVSSNLLLHDLFSFDVIGRGEPRLNFEAAKVAPKGTSPRLLDMYRQRHKNVRARFVKNDLKALSIYNRNVVYQCFRAVYSSSQTIYGLSLPAPGR